MYTVSKMPLYTINKDVLDKDQTYLNTDNLQGKLEDFLAEHSTSLEHKIVKIGYNAYEIKILCKTLHTWTEDIHEKFVDNFNVLLYEVEIEEDIHAKEREFSILYTYIPKFIKKKHNEEYAVDFRYILGLIP